MFDHAENASNANEVTPKDPSPGEAEAGTPHKVGYCSPPLHTRFQKGASGNRYGRPKRRPTADDMLLEEADRLIKVKENGHWTKMTSEQVMYCNMVRAAVKGDFKAIKGLLALMAEQEEKYGWAKVGWNKSNRWETMNWKKEMEFMITETPEDTVAE